MNNKSRYFLLDIFKIFSAILIVFHHFQQATELRFNYLNFYNGAFNFGYLVELFFIISGFLLLNSINNRFDSKSFLKKLLRLFPMAIIACGFDLIVGIIQYNNLNFYPSEAFEQPLIIISSFLLLFRGIPFLSTIGINNPAWYLCVLIQCYFMFYLISFLPKKIKRFIPFIIIIIMFSFLKVFNFLPDFMQDSSRGYIAFFIGCLLFEIKDYMSFKLKFIISFLAILIGFVMLVLIRNYYYWPLLLLIYPGMILFASCFDKTNNKIVSFACGVSFDVYLFHGPIINLFILLKKMNILNYDYSFFSMIILTILIIVFSVLMYILCEKNINKLINKIFSLPKKRSD